MADSSSSRKDIPPDQMFHLYFPDVDKIPKVTPSSRWRQPQAVLTHYDLCNLYEKLCRRLMFPNLKLWSEPTVYREGRNTNRFTYTNEFLSVGNDELRPPKLAASIASTSTWQSVFTTLFRNIFDKVPFLDPDAPIIKARSQNMGYGDSQGAGSYGTKTTWKASSITSEESEGSATATPHSIPGSHIFACISDWRQDTKLKQVMMATLPASVDTTIEALAVAAAALPEGPAREQAIAELETARQRNQAQAEARLNDATAALEEANEAQGAAQREYDAANGARTVATENKTSADQAALAGRDSCNAAKEVLSRAQQALAEATTDEERESAQAAVDEAQEALDERLEVFDKLLAAQQEAMEAVQTAQQKYSAAEDKLEAATSKCEECESEKQEASQSLQEVRENADIIKHPTQAIYIPEHGLYYHPEGYTSDFPQTGEKFDKSSDQFERIAGLFTVGSEWGNKQLRRYALLSFYPKIPYNFQGSKINQQWQGATSDQQVRTIAILDRVGAAKWDSNLEIAGGKESPGTEVTGEDGKPALDEHGARTYSYSQPSYVYPVPPPMYTWNYWDHYNLPESWGSAPGIEDLRKVFLPPMPDTILAAHLYINQYPPDKASMDEIRDTLLQSAARAKEREDEEQAAALEQQAANMVPSKSRPSIKTGGSYPSATPRNPRSSDGPLVASDRVLPTPGPTGGWKSPALISQFFKSLFDWTDRFRYTLFPLDLSAIAYTVNAKESGKFVDTSNSHYEYPSRTWDYQFTNTLSFTVQANGRGTGSRVIPYTWHKTGIDVDGPFTMRLPAIRNNVSGQMGQTNTSATTHKEERRPNGNNTSSTFTDTSTSSLDLNATAYVRTSKFRPLVRSIGRVEAGRATISATYTTHQQPDDTGSNDRPVAPKQIQYMEAPNATVKEDNVALLTPGNMQFMNSCRMLVLVKVRIEVPASRTTYETRTLTTNKTLGAGGLTENDNSTGETHQGRASSRVEAFRLLDLGTPDDTGTFNVVFDPITLMEGLTLPPISGPGADSGLASKATSVIWSGYDPSSYGHLWPSRRYFTKSETLNTQYELDEIGGITGGSQNGELSASEFVMPTDDLAISVDCQWAGLLIDWDFDAVASVTQSPTKASKVGKDVDDALNTIADAIYTLTEDKRQASAERGRASELKSYWTSEYDKVVKDSEALAKSLADTANAQTAHAKEEEAAVEKAYADIDATRLEYAQLSPEEQVARQEEFDNRIAQLRNKAREHQEYAKNLKSGAACRKSHADELQDSATQLEKAKVNTIQQLYTPIKNTADKLESDIDEMLSTLQEKLSRIEEIKNEELPPLQTGIADAAAAIERYTEQVQNAKDNIARYEDEVATAENALTSAEEDRTSAEGRLQDARQLPSDDEGRAEAIQEAQQALQDAERAVQAATETLQEATDKLAQANTRLVDATAALEDAKATEARLMAELQEKSDELDNLWNANDRAAVYAINNRVSTLEIKVDEYNIKCENTHFAYATSFAQHDKESKNCWKKEETSG